MYSLKRTTAAASAMSALIFLCGCENKSSHGASAEDMKAIAFGISYQEVVDKLGKPCFENQASPTHPIPACAWRTTARDTGVYIEFWDGKVGGIVDFDKTSFTYRKGSKLTSFIMNDRNYRTQIHDLLK